MTFATLLPTPSACRYNVLGEMQDAGPDSCSLAERRFPKQHFLLDVYSSWNTCPCLFVKPMTWSISRLFVAFRERGGRAWLSYGTTVVDLGPERGSRHLIQFLQFLLVGNLLPGVIIMTNEAEVSGPCSIRMIRCWEYF